MMWIKATGVAVLAAITLTLFLAATEPDATPTPAADLEERAASIEVNPRHSEALRTYVTSLLARAGDEQQVLPGEDGWLFLASELKHLAADRFWGEAAAAVSTASNDAWADPLPAIVDFNEQVDKAGARLIFVPVPPKAAIYPDKLPGSAVDQAPAARVDATHARFVELLRESGVEVLDLTPVFLAHRQQNPDDDDDRLYCRTDTHWSPLACKLTAQLLHQRIGEVVELPEAGPLAYALAQRTLKINGDLRQMQDEPTVPQEKLPAWLVSAGDQGPPADDRDSPVLMVGDSHLLVYHVGGDMHARGAGVADHLGRLLGGPVDVVGVRGSGASPSRIALFRRRDELAGKKVVIWCLTAREFTQTTGWRKVPIVR